MNKIIAENERREPKLIKLREAAANEQEDPDRRWRAAFIYYSIAQAMYKEAKDGY